MALKTPPKEKAPAKTPKPRAARAPKAAKASPAEIPATMPAAEPRFSEILFNTEPCGFLAPAPPYMWIDYPAEGETLRATEYVIRLGVGGEQNVEIAFDDGLWQACRNASGFWWYDWSAIAPGTHTMVARMQTPEGVWYRTPVRTCHFPT